MWPRITRRCSRDAVLGRHRHCQERPCDARTHRANIPLYSCTAVSISISIEFSGIHVFRFRFSSCIDIDIDRVIWHSCFQIPIFDIDSQWFLTIISRAFPLSISNVILRYRYWHQLQYCIDIDNLDFLLLSKRLQVSIDSSIEFYRGCIDIAAAECIDTVLLFFFFYDHCSSNHAQC